ncbi:MAG TPA: 50S ribosomal protein L21 [Thermoanaerobaculia bacterium]|jgi:large subunit ribosomal protein L21|nr:50S ribosomal protein L21 [Thermoanaerobaculia bacterium]
MYAVIQSGGKQYRVTPGDVLDIELLPGREGEAIRFDRVLMVGGNDGGGADSPGNGGFQVGNPVIAGALVNASLVRELRGPKIRVFKKKKRKQYRRTNGHRQDLLRVRIDDIHLPSATSEDR